MDLSLDTYLGRGCWKGWRGGKGRGFVRQACSGVGGGWGVGVGRGDELRAGVQASWLRRRHSWLCPKCYAGLKAEM